MYRNVWEEVISIDSDVGILPRISACVAKLKSKLSTKRPIQYLSEKKSTIYDCQPVPGYVTFTASLCRVFPLKYLSKTLSHVRYLISYVLSKTFLVTKADDTVVPMTSLDQLYIQAAGVDIFLRRKTKALASKCNGHFPSALLSENQPQFLKWKDVEEKSESWRVLLATLKPSERALEKLLRSYDSDVSYLLDCCRQRIIFETPEFDIQYDDKYSGGYR